jgi:hypothetical protein
MLKQTRLNNITTTINLHEGDMKKIIFLVLFSGIINFAYAEEFDIMAAGDLVAPIVKDKDDISAPQAGTIIFDATDSAFYGLDNTGSWVLLSPSSVNGSVTSSASLAAYGTTAGNYGDLTSLQLTAGEWLISATVCYYANGAVTTGQVETGVSTTSGNSSAGLSLASNRVAIQKNQTNSAIDCLTISPYKVSPTATTTYYLKGWAGTNITNLQVAYNVVANRVK